MGLFQQPDCSLDNLRDCLDMQRAGLIIYITEQTIQISGGPAVYIIWKAI